MLTLGIRYVLLPVYGLVSSGCSKALFVSSLLNFWPVLSFSLWHRVFNLFVCFCVGFYLLCYMWVSIDFFCLERNPN